jgi:Putative Flp pilus-assembly TadE/G-like
MTRRLGDERGQAAVLTVLFMTVLLGMSAIAIDVGSWYKAKRSLQATADAAALAGAQALPESTSSAQALAIQYAQQNGGALDASGITFSGGIVSNDTITVKLKQQAPGFFSQVFGIGSVNVGASAAARSDNISQALGVAPITVFWKHPMLQCNPPPCTGPTEIDLGDIHTPGSGNAAGAFGLIDLDPNGNGTEGASTLGDWITQGFDHYMQIGNYNSVPSAMFNSSNVVSAMQVSIGKELLFPVYKVVTGPGQNAMYQIIGWVGFYVTGFNGSGDSTGATGTVYGHFTRYIAQGIQVDKNNPNSDFGVRDIQLIQ